MILDKKHLKTIAAFLVIYVVFSVFAYNYFSQGSSPIIPYRLYEDQTYFPERSPYDTILEHVRIIAPTLSIAMVVGVLIFMFGPVAVMKTTAKFCVLSVLAVFLMTFFIDLRQFLIILFPLLSSYRLTSLLVKDDDIIEKVNVFFLLLCAQIVLVAQGLSLLNSLHAKGFLMVTMAVFLISLRFPVNFKASLVHDLKNTMSSWKKLLRTISQNKLLAVFCCSLLVSVFWRLHLIIYVQPNNPDGLLYHLSRIAYWLQHHSFRPFITHNLRQICFPFNAEILCLWTMVSSKLDYLCGFIQMICYLLSGTLVYKCCRKYLDCDMRVSLLTAFVWYALPQTVLQSTSVQNDLVVSYFVMFCLVYFLLGRSEEPRRLIFSGLALGLAVGTKASIWSFILPFSMVVLFFVFRRLISFKRCLLWTASFLISLILVGSYSYIQNYLTYGQVLGPEKFIDLHRIVSPSLKMCLSVFFEHLFDIVMNQCSLPFYISIFSDFYNDFAAGIGRAVFDLFHIPINLPGSFSEGGFFFNSWRHKFKIHEDFALFGIVGLIMVLLAFVIIIRGAFSFLLRKKFNFKYFIFSFLFVGFLLSFSFVKLYDPWSHRMLNIIFLTGIPILTMIFIRKGLFFKYLTQAVQIYMILFLIPLTFMNQLKPLTPYKRDIFGLRNVWKEKYGADLIKGLPPFEGGGWSRLTYNKDRIGTANMLRPQNEIFMRNFNKMVPPDARVGVILSFWQPDYLLFGEKFTRTIVPLNKENLVNTKCDYVIASQRVFKEKPQLLDLLLLKYKKDIYLGHAWSGKKMFLYVPLRDFAQISHGSHKKHFEERGQEKGLNFKYGLLDKEIRKHYPDGKLREIRNYRNGVRHGVRVKYLHDGSLKGEWNYKNDKLNGIVREYHANGQMWIERHYKNGKRDGRSRRYFSNGQLEVEAYYEQGKFEREYKEYYESGQMKRKGEYINNQIVWEKNYNENGQLISDETF